MKKWWFLIIIICRFELYSGSNNSLYYLSPGIKLNWDFHHCFLFETKLSFGYMDSETRYYNCTIGYTKPIIKNDEFKNLKHVFCQIYHGYYHPFYPQSIGTGMGMAFFRDSGNINIFPKMTISYGSGLFCTVDYILIKNSLYLGIQGVLPIPFDEDYRDFRM